MRSTLGAVPLHPKLRFSLTARAWLSPEIGCAPLSASADLDTKPWGCRCWGQIAKERPAPQLASGLAGAPGPAEGIEHDLALVARLADQLAQQLDRLLRRVATAHALGAEDIATV